MYFHFANEDYLRKVDSFRDISEKMKIFTFFFFCISYNVASRNFGGKSQIWIQRPKKHIYIYAKNSELPQNFPHRGPLEHNLTGPLEL